MKQWVLIVCIFLMSSHINAYQMKRAGSKDTASGAVNNIKTTNPADDHSQLNPQPLTLIPPDKQNLVDLQTLMEFLMREENQTIAMTLESIDLMDKSIHFNQGCKAMFTREMTEHSDCGHSYTLGPAGPLTLNYIICN